jgi:hypothetical protein
MLNWIWINNTYGASFSPGLLIDEWMTMHHFEMILKEECQSQWPRVLRRRSSAASLLRLWVRIPQEAWMFVCCEYCVLSGRGLCDGLITLPEESYRLWRVVVCVQETSKTRRLKPDTGLWKVQTQWVVAPGKQTNNKLTGEKAEYLEKNLSPVPLRLPPIARRLACDRTRTFTMRGRRLTPWATARHAAMLYNEASPRTVSLNRSFPIGDCSVLVTPQFAPNGRRLYRGTFQNIIREPVSCCRRTANFSWELFVSPSYLRHVRDAVPMGIFKLLLVHGNFLPVSFAANVLQFVDCLSEHLIYTIYYCCLFSWRYNPLRLYFPQPGSGI